jgi:transcriptional regulator with XRE-family HTH domain
MFIPVFPIYSPFFYHQLRFLPKLLIDNCELMLETTEVTGTQEVKVFGETACSGNSETSMATALAPVDSREVVRCDHCHLVQFRTNNNLCRKCRTSLDEDEPEPILEVQAPVEPPSNGHHSHLQVASAIRMLRQKSGLSQRQLALRMSVPRTYVSKIENEKAMPTLSSLQRLATALEVSMADLLKGSSRSLEDDIADLMHDEFIAEIIQCLDKLDSMQRSSLLSQVRDLSIRPRRSA